MGKEISISGKIKFYKNKYQLTNPKYVSEDSSLIKQKHNTYPLTDGISEKVYNKIISQIINKLPILDEWHSRNIISKFDNISWNDSIKELHNHENKVFEFHNASSLENFGESRLVITLLK